MEGHLALQSQGEGRVVVFSSRFLSVMTRTGPSLTEELPVCAMSRFGSARLSGPRTARKDCTEAKVKTRMFPPEVGRAPERSQPC